MDELSDDLLKRLVLTAVLLIVVVPLAIALSWAGITGHDVWGYAVAIATGMLTLWLVALLPRVWRGYGHELRSILFPDYLSPYWSPPRHTTPDADDDV